MVTRRDYSADAVSAARSVLVELTHLLREYRKDIVLIGGWVPRLLLSEDHIGSTDVDLAFNHRSLSAGGYQTILELLLKQGYEQGKQPYIFHRTVRFGDRELQVQVDLLAGEYEGTGKNHRHQKVQEIQARKVRGCDLAFEISISEVSLKGDLPGGGKDSVTVRVASIVSFIVMKGMALENRLKAKDAWDICYCLENYPGGLDKLAEDFHPHLEKNLVREGLEKIAKHFASESHLGPKFVADFEEVTDPEAQELRQRDAYEKLTYLLKKLQII